jgi:hypothetical protein
MIKRSDNRGQFYLLSAIVIISIIIGFSAISTYTKKTGEIRVIDLGEELGIESSNVLDYGTYNIEQASNLSNFLIDFASNYSEYLGEDTELSFIFGSPEDTTATVVNYEEIITSSVSYGSSTITTTSRLENVTYSDVVSSGDTKTTRISFKGQDYDFELKPGENFYFVISQNVGEEVHTTTSGNR